MAKSTTTLASASGYPNYSALTEPIFADGLIAQFYCSSISGYISSTDIVPTKLRTCGDEVIFRRPPTGELHDYIKNQELEVSTWNVQTVSMYVKRSKYWNYKIDIIDETQICDFKKWMNEVIDNTNQQMMEQIDYELLVELPLEAASCNKGRRAGMRSGAFDLGTLGAPVQLTTQNLVRKIIELGAVLDEACVPKQGRFLVLPTAAQVLLADSKIWEHVAPTDGKNPVLTGNVPNVWGFEILFSNFAPRYRDNGRDTYTILAGLKRATAFVTQLTESQIVDSDRHFGKLWRGFTLYDFKVIQPEALAVLYGYFDM